MLRHAQVVVPLTVASLLAWLVVACVGDAPVAGNDASVGNDGSVSSDASDAAAPDAGGDAALVFDGANGSCNDLLPSQAPQSATVECSGTNLSIDAGGGVIPVGHYYLYDQVFLPPFCGAAGSRPPVNDAVDIAAADGGFLVDYVTDGANARRGTLFWTMTDATHFRQSDVCPSDEAGAPSVPYDVSSSGSTTVLHYRLPLSVVTLKSY